MRLPSRLTCLISVSALHLGCSGPAPSTGPAGAGGFPPAPDGDVRDDDGRPDPAPGKPRSIALRAASELILGRAAPVKHRIEIVREGTPAEVAIHLEGLPTGFTAAPVTLSASQSFVEIVVAASDAAPTSPVAATIVAASGPLTARASLKVLAPRSAFDPSFGTAGKVSLPFAASDLAVLGDGRTLVIGSTRGDYWGTWAMRLLAANGSGDPSFAAGGTFVSPTPSGWSSVDGAAIAAKGDGTFYALLNAGMDTSSARKMVVVHVLATGALDTAFGSAGYAPVSFAGWTYAWGTGMAVEASGKIVVVGGATNSSSSYADNPRAAVLARFHPTGQLDATFGTGGRIATSWGGTHADARGIRVLGGNTYAFGRGDYVSGTLFRGVVVRLNDAGAPDTAFGAGGVAATTLPVDEVALTPSGKVLVRSTSQYEGGVIQQLRADGTNDGSFGNNGHILDVSPLPGIGYARDKFPFALGTNGNVYAMLGSLYGDTLEIWAFDPTGQRIAGFAGGGKLSITGEEDPVPAVLRASADGRFVGLVKTSSGSSEAAFVTRFFP